MRWRRLWKVGKRVIVRLLRGREAGVCDCELSEPGDTGANVNGGYAEMIIAESRGVGAIPRSLTLR